MHSLQENILKWSFICKCKPSKDILDILVDGEEVIQCYKTIRDIAALTNKRIIIRDSQGVTGLKVDIYSIPYKSITMWSSENVGPLDLTAELQFCTRSGDFKIEIATKCDIREFDRIIGNEILK